MESKFIKKPQILVLCAIGLDVGMLAGLLCMFSLSRQTIFVIIGLVILFLLLLLIFAYIHKRIRIPIRNLQDALKSISKGETERTIELDENEELQILGKEITMIREKINQLGKEREKADRMTQEVIGNITHDLKTPLTAIKGYSQGILDGIARTPERLNKYVTTIQNKADDMSGLVDELSFFTLIYQNNIQYNLQDVNANDYLSGCVSELSLDLEMKKINLVYQYLADREITIRIDLDKMKRVINNIIGNASKYINNDMGIVYVHVEEERAALRVQVQDNGIGIAEGELPYVFERFYRTDSSRNSKTGGSGLGLAIAKKIIEDHGGQIWAESKQEKGTKIIFRIPKDVDRRNE